jgi:hypothetical protein
MRAERGFGRNSRKKDWKGLDLEDLVYGENDGQARRRDIALIMGLRGRSSPGEKMGGRMMWTYDQNGS